VRNCETFLLHHRAIQPHRTRVVAQRAAGLTPAHDLNSKAPRGTSGAGASSADRINKRKRSRASGAVAEDATVPATPPAQALERTGLEMAPRKAQRAAQSHGHGMQIEADVAHRTEAAARGAAAAWPIEATGIGFMHMSVAQNTFTASSRAHDADAGAAVRRTIRFSGGENCQPQPGRFGERDVAAFVAACCKGAAAKLMQPDGN
jgi:hypothetical protein